MKSTKRQNLDRCYFGNINTKLINFFENLLIVRFWTQK